MDGFGVCSGLAEITGQTITPLPNLGVFRRFMLLKPRLQQRAATGQGSEQSFQQRKIEPSQVAGQNSISKDIDCGIRSEIIMPQGAVQFSPTAKSVQCDQDLGIPLIHQNDIASSSVCLGSGSNGCVVDCTINGKEAVAKRSYCLIDTDYGRPFYPNSSGIIREAGVLTGLGQQRADHPGFINIVPFLGAGVTAFDEPLIFLGKADTNLESRLAKDPVTLQQVCCPRTGSFCRAGLYGFPEPCSSGYQTGQSAVER